LTRVRFLDEFEHGFGWTPDEVLRRTSHAVLAGGGVWVTDPVDGDGIDERIRALGEPRAVIQLLDRHNRDCQAVASRLDVPLHVTPFEGVPGAAFEARKIMRVPTWREVALWFPAERILVTGDALGSVGYFRAANEPFGVHPMLRLMPPRKALGDLQPRHLLFGHGDGYHGVDGAAALREALATARVRLPAALFRALRSGLRRSAP
jgi:hypothetical protein